MSEKYKKGDRVECVFGHPVWVNENNELKIVDRAPELVGQKGTIQYSYYSEYGSGTLDSYCILWDSGSAIAWYSLGQLKSV